MKKDLVIIETLKNKGFSNIDIDQIFNYLETLDYDLKNLNIFVKFFQAMNGQQNIFLQEKSKN